MTNHYEAKQCNHIWFDVTANGDQSQIHACAECGAKKKTSFDEYTDTFTHLENHIGPNTVVINLDAEEELNRGAWDE